MQARAANAPATTPYFAARRVGHVNLYVGDLDASMQFYQTVVGIEEVYRTPAAGGGFVSNGNTHHDVGFIDAGGALAKSRGALPGQLNHFAFELETEAALVESYRRAVDDGETFLRTMDHDIAHSVYNVDPDGNVYELYADVVRDWRSQRSGIVTKPKPHWAPGTTPPVAEPCYHVDPEIRRSPEALFHPVGTTHATFVVRDLDAAIAHYERIVGLRVVSRGADGSIAAMSGACPGACLTLIRSGPTRSVGYHHVGLRVASQEDLEQSVETARAAGVPIEVEIHDAHRRAVLLRDPDGFLVQLYADDAIGPDLDAITADFALYLL